jgi:hypothetical protein
MGLSGICLLQKRLNLDMVTRKIIVEMDKKFVILARLFLFQFELKLRCRNNFRREGKTGTLKGVVPNSTVTFVTFLQ